MSLSALAGKTAAILVSHGFSENVLINLQKQLNEANHDNHEHKSTIPKINFDDYPVSPLDQFLYQLKDFKEINSEKSYFVNDTSQDFFKSVFKPPQVVS